MTSIQIKLLESKLHFGSSLKVSRCMLSKIGTNTVTKITQIQKKDGYKAMLIFKWKYLIWNIFLKYSFLHKYLLTSLSPLLISIIVFTNC